MTDAPHPITVLIGAMGGEGGGVLMNWVVNAAVAQGLPVQATSVPGVAQRTGATTYYIEIYPVPHGELGGREPVFALYPSIGDVDLVVASELVEVGRAIERGFVSPERTTLIGSTHRVYSIAEKSSGTDARYESERVLDTARKMAKRTILFDAERAARESGSVLNAVLLGAIAGSSTLPIPRKAFEEGIRAEARAMEANLAGFSRGLAHGQGEVAPAPRPPPATTPPALPSVDRRGGNLRERVRRQYPEAVHKIVLEGVRRLVDYQDEAYAGQYLERLEAILASDRDGEHGFTLTAETARYLALWMSYEDVIRVAQLKTRRERFERVRSEIGLEPHQVVEVTEFLKPSIEELCSVLPPLVARPILSWAERRGLMQKLEIGLQVKSTTVSGFLRLWLISKLRSLRRLGYRYAEEQRMIEGWLDRIRRAAAIDRRFATEIAECAHLIRGYGDTHRRGVAHYERIMSELVDPALGGEIPADRAAEAVAKARSMALANPEAPAPNREEERPAAPPAPAGRASDRVRAAPGAQRREP